MSETHLLGLTRNRLFEFDNAVLFAGKFPEKPVESDCEKAFRMLVEKEQILSGTVKLNEDSSAELVIGSVEPGIVFSSENLNEIKNNYSLNGLDFSKRLFEITITADDYFVVAGHTVVADVKSLMRLASLFVGFYNRTNLSVDASKVLTFPDSASLPLEIMSPLTDKLASELDDRWSKVDSVFSVEDYKSARQKYVKNRGAVEEKTYTVVSDDFRKLVDFCAENGIDFSSLVAYGFYKSLCENVQVEKKHRKLSLFVDRRFFINGAEACNVGGFDGAVSVSFNKKEQKMNDVEQLKAFHFSCYKGATSCYKSFYEESLLMKISPAYCDSAYMYIAGQVNNKCSKKLAENYSCKNTRLCSFFGTDLRQNYWSSLSFFDEVLVYTPFKSRYLSNLSLVVNNGAYINFRYNADAITGDVASRVGEQAVKLILSFVN